MSRTYTAREICARALRQIGAFPITENAPDGEQLREALIWLDLIMAERAGVGRLFWQIPDTLTLTLQNEVQDYLLSATLGAELPVDGIQFPVQAFLEDGAGNRSPLPIVTRETFRHVFKSDQLGVPAMIYIDRLPSPTLSVFPILPPTNPVPYVIKLDVQTYAPNVAPSGVSGTRPDGSALTSFRQAWQRYLVYRLSFDLGSGPIHKLPAGSLNVFKQEIREAEDALTAWENQQHDTEDPVIHARY